MFRYIYLLLFVFSLPLLTQCAMTPPSSVNAVTGPFDSRGNYVEAWVDRKEKWHRPQAPSQQQAYVRPSPPPPSYTSKPNPQPSQPLAVRPVSPESKPIVSLPKPAASQSKPLVSQPKPVASASKPKPKPQAKTTTYIVKQGDTLGKIASKYKVSLTALRKANRISGDLIRTGQSLKIPR